MNGTQTLGRALDILFVLAEAGSTLTVSEIAERVSIPESTAYRFLQTLEQNGIIERKGKGQVSLGLRILDLARSLHQQMDQELLITARPMMEELREKIGETSILCIRSGVHAICIQNVESLRLIRMSIENGRILPLHLGASGKALLAFEGEKVICQVEQTLDNDAQKVKLRNNLEEIRTLGYSTTVGEVDTDVFAIAAPIFDTHYRIVASLTLAGPVGRFDKERLPGMIEVLLETTARISQKLGRPEEE